MQRVAQLAAAPHSWPAQVPRLDARSLSAAELARLRRSGQPLLLTHALPELDHGRWLSQLVRAAGDEPVVYQEQLGGVTELYEARLRDALGACAGASSHDAAVFLFDEELLPRCPPKLRLTPAAHPLFAGCDAGFAAFPRALRPAPCCLLAGGLGARSSLHADPYNWTGWNYCLEGTKLWTFFPAGPAADAALRAVRKPPNAWSAGVELAAGWESPVDLYRAQGAQGGFLPSEPLPEALESGALRCRQAEGELLLIPPAMWHQTYHEGPTLATAGQFLDAANARGVFAHILAWCAAPAALLRRPGLRRLPLREQVQAVLVAALQAKLGAAEGRELWRRLRADSLRGALGRGGGIVRRKLLRRSL